MMTKEQFRQALKRNGCSCDDFASIAGRDVKTVYDFGGRYPVPIYARTLLRLFDERGGIRGLITR